MLRPSKFILIFAFVCLSLAAAARPEGIFNPAATFVGDLQGIDSNKASGAAATAPTLDGSATSSVGSTATNTVTLTTTNTNDEIVVFASVNGCGTIGVNTIAATSAHLTFTYRIGAGAGNSPPNCVNNTIIEFVAFASAALTSEVITVTESPGTGVNYMEVQAFGVHGINTGSPFDANVSIPGAVSSGALSISTTHAADFIFAGFRGGGPPTPDAGWTTIINGSFVGCEFIRVTTTQSGLAPGGSNGNNGGIGDAIVSP